MPPQVGIDSGGPEIPDSSLPIDESTPLDIRHFTSVSAAESSVSVWAHAGPRRPGASRFASLVVRTAAGCPYLYLEGADDESSGLAVGAAGAAGLRPTAGEAGDSEIDASCLALAEAVPVGRRQIALVCGGAGHVGCPRFAHGGLGERPVPPARLRAVIGIGPTVERGRSDRPASDRPASDRPASDRPASKPPESDVPGPGIPTAVTAAPVLSLNSPASTAAAAIDTMATFEPTDTSEPDQVTAAPDVEVAALADASATSAGSLEAPAGLRATSAASDPAFEAEAPVPARTPVGPPSIARSRAGRQRPRASGVRIASQAHRRAVAVRPATLASVAVLVGAFVLALAFVAGRGGLNVPGAGPATPSLLAAATESAIPSPTHRPTASPSPSSPTASRTPKPTKSPQPSGSPSPTIAPDVLALLTPCADTPDCVQYRVRPGDNLHKIADLFGVPYRTLLSLNPEITNPSIIHVGQLIKLPPPGGA